LNGSREFIVTGVESPLAADIQVFPNPVTSQLFIESGTTIIESVTLVNAMGQTISKNLTGVNKFRIIIATENIAAGIYFIKIFAGNKIYVKRVVVTTQIRTNRLTRMSRLTKKVLLPDLSVRKK